MQAKGVISCIGVLGIIGFGLYRNHQLDQGLPIENPVAVVDFNNDCHSDVLYIERGKLDDVIFFVDGNQGRLHKNENGEWIRHADGRLVATYLKPKDYGERCHEKEEYYERMKRIQIMERFDHPLFLLAVTDAFLAEGRNYFVEQKTD